jgi:hypothetical protein
VAVAEVLVMETMHHNQLVLLVAVEEDLLIQLAVVAVEHQKQDCKQNVNIKIVVGILDQDIQLTPLQVMKVHHLEVKDNVAKHLQAKHVLVEEVVMVSMDLAEAAEDQDITLVVLDQMVVELADQATEILMEQMVLKELMDQVAVAEAAIMVQHQDVVEMALASLHIG